MTTTYTQFTKQTASKKITLVHLDMKREVKVFTTSGTSHTRTEDFFVVAVTINGDAGTFTFTPSTNVLGITFDGDLAAQEVIVTYRLFMADYDIITTNDLTLTGEDVKYRGLIKRVPGFSTSLNFASSNKTVIGTGTLQLDNSTGFFNELLELYRFENKEFSAYSWSPNIPINEHKIIYKGTTAQASIQNDSLNFKVKDSIFSLNNQLPLVKFTSSEVIERDRGRFKKQIFGKVNGMRVQSISQNGDGYDLTGTLSGDAGSTLLQGTNTIFLEELVPRDKITINNIQLTIRKIINNQALILTEAISGTITTGVATVQPSRQWYNRNRTYSVANHRLKQFQTTITRFVDLRRIAVDSSDGFEAGDTVIILGEAYIIDRISKVYTDATRTATNDVIVLSRTLSSNNLPSISDTITTREISNVEVQEIPIIDANVSIVNDTNSLITLSNDAEQVAAVEGVLGNDITAIANTDYYILGTPTIQTLMGTTSTSFLGTSFRLSKEDDTTADDKFVWFGPEENIREFTTIAAALVNFKPGDLYLDITDDKYIGIKTITTGPGIDGTDSLDLGSNEPIRVQLTIGEVNDSTIVSNKLMIALSLTRSIWLFGFTISGSTFTWKLFTNQGINVVANTISAVGFTLNSNALSAGATPETDISLSESVKPRDLIRTQNKVTFSQVVQSELTFVQVSETIGTDETGTGFFKNPIYSTDTGLVTLSSFGQTFDGTIAGDFVKTPSDASRKVLEDNGLTGFIDNTTFNEASINEDLTIGIYAPFKIGDKPPTILEMINKITLTGLASVGLNDNFMLKYQLLNGFKPTTLNDIRVIRNNEITNRADEDLAPSPLFRYTIRNLEASYDFGEAEPSEKLIVLEDAKIGRLTDLNTTQAVDLYTTQLDRATDIGDRFLNYSQRFNRIISFRGSLSLSDVNIGDIVLLDILELRNLRDDNIPFIGMVTNFYRDSVTVGMKIEDFGGLFKRAAGLSDSTLGDFTSSTVDAKLLGTFLTDANGVIDNDESTLDLNVLV